MDLDLHIDGYDGQNIWIDFRPVGKNGGNFPVLPTSAGDRRLSKTEKYELTTIDMSRLAGKNYRILQYTTSGLGSITYEMENGTREYELPDGKCFFITPELKYRFWKPDGMAWNYIYIGFCGIMADYMFEWVLNCGAVHTLPRESKTVHSFTRLFNRALRRNLDNCELKILACEILLNLQDDIRHSSISKEDGFKLDVDAWVGNHLDSADVQSMARHYGYNEKYFQSFFVRKMGMTPGKFIQNRRLTQAKRLLECTMMKLSGVAALSGFTDASHLCRLFRKKYGCSPDKYRGRH